MARPRHVRLPVTSGRPHPVADGRTVLTLALAAALHALAGCDRPALPFVLATTTSVGNSGLLDHILPGYEGTPVRPLLVGSGRALEMLADGTADVVITHAPMREAAMLAAHPSWWYRKILYNDFLIVGPSSDPAGVLGSADAVDAMRRIARSPSVFLSRGDESGTHERERELWKAAGSSPDGKRHVIAGAGMGQTLRIAGSTGAYTLTDRGTFEALAASLDLVVLHAGDDRLLNTYAVIADPVRARGLAFGRWLAEGRGRELTKQAVEGGAVKGFSLWPTTTPNDKPGDTPGRISLSGWFSVRGPSPAPARGSS